MKSCADCVTLERQLFDASEYYLGLIVQQHRMIRDGNPEASELAESVREALGRRDFAAQSLLAHQREHDQLSSPAKTSASV